MHHEQYLEALLLHLDAGAVRLWLHSIVTQFPLDAVGLVVLADIQATARRTALTGTSALLDILVLCPGLHRQQEARNLSQGEFPACANITSGYVFRVENPGTVSYLQNVSCTNHLTTLSVEDNEQSGDGLVDLLRRCFDPNGNSLVSTVAYMSAAGLSITTIILLVLIRDWWALSFVVLLVFVRLVNVLAIRSAAVKSWHGAEEPGVRGDLLVLLSYDRWVRIKGLTDNLKAVTSGRWLREPGLLEKASVSFATLLVYLDVALASKATVDGKILILALLSGSAALLGLTNEWTQDLRMKGKILKVRGKTRSYGRRRELVDELVEETGRKDWAVGMGMLPGGNVSAIM